MEKTNNNIPSAEELAIYIKEATVSVTNTYEQSPVVLMVDDSIIGTLGNFSASIGKAKSKKTFNVSAIAASALANSTVLHYRSSFPENKRTILYIDTEQGEPHCQKVLQRILYLAGLPKDADSDNLIMSAEIFSRNETCNSRTGYWHNSEFGSGHYRWHQGFYV